MNKEVKEKWLAWLRDPAHKQGRNQLLRIDGTGAHYCCLGGLCEVYRAEVGGEWHEEYFHDGTGDLSHTDLLTGVAEWADIDEIGSFERRELPYWDDRGTRFADNLIHLNDELGWSFEQIADFIEENF